MWQALFIILFFVGFVNLEGALVLHPVVGYLRWLPTVYKIRINKPLNSEFIQSQNQRPILDKKYDQERGVLWLVIEQHSLFFGILYLRGRQDLLMGWKLSDDRNTVESISIKSLWTPIVMWIMFLIYIWSGKPMFFSVVGTIVFLLSALKAFRQFNVDKNIPLKSVIEEAVKL